MMAREASGVVVAGPESRRAASVSRDIYCSDPVVMDEVNVGAGLFCCEYRRNASIVLCWSSEGVFLWCRIDLASIEREIRIDQKR